MLVSEASDLSRFVSISLHRGLRVRVGIVSDVHGNSLALARGLELMGEVDQLLCAGDIVEEFRFSNETVSLLREREAICVLGNHDSGFLGLHGERARSASHVDHDLVEWLGSHPSSVRLDIDGKQLLMTHASPCSPHTQYVMAGSLEVKRLAAVDADYVVIGHTHCQMVERVGRALVINPGSVGQARDPANGKHLSFAILDTSTDDVYIENFLMSTHDGQKLRSSEGKILR